MEEFEQKLYMMTVSQWKLKHGSNNKEVIKLVNGLTYSKDLVYSELKK